MLLGGAGEVSVEFVRDRGCADPAADLRDARARFPSTSTVVGTALARQLPPSIVDDAGTVVAPAEHLCTSAWIALAARWPLTEPVLVADYDPYAHRLYTCGLRPVRSS
jgi:hypothetical protein